MRKCISAVSLSIYILMSLSAADAQDGGTLPAVSGRNLSDQALNLPADLPAEPTLIIMTFEQDQQGQADRWIDGIQRLIPNVAWMEFAVIAPLNAFVRGMITAGMRRETPDSARRARFVTIFTPPVPFAKSLGCSTTLKTVCVAVVDRNGHVRGLVSAAYSAEAAQPVLDRLNP